MKLATYKDGSRDGQLVVVSRDLTTAHYATGIAHRMQQVLDDWNFMLPQLQDLSHDVNQGKARHAFAFDPRMCMAPLPRAHQWADGSAYMNHVELVRASRHSDVPENYYTEPLMYQGGSDDFLGPCDDVVCPSEDFGIDFEASGEKEPTFLVPICSPFWRRSARPFGIDPFVLPKSLRNDSFVSSAAFLEPSVEAALL